MNELFPYLPQDRLVSLANGTTLPDRAFGAVLFADISGFTRLTENLVQELGSYQGAEELTRLLNRVYTELIEQVHNYRGSVIGFSGDAITCWFDADDGQRAVAAGLGMQAILQGLPEVINR